MLNTCGKQILAASALIDEQSNGQIRLTYNSSGALTKWNLYRNGEIVVNGWSNADAHAFVRGWQMANEFRSVNA
jgi:hypothetical protein